MLDRQIVIYTGPERHMAIGGVWLQPGETYELPAETVRAYSGLLATEQELATADEPDAPGPSILHRKPPREPRPRKTPPPAKPATKRAAKSGGRKR